MGKTIVIKDDRLDLIEYNIWVEEYGKEEADKLYAEVNGEPFDPLDDELQELLSDLPALDEIDDLTE